MVHKRYLVFQILPPSFPKKTVIIGLAHRAIQLSDPQYRQEAINKATNALILSYKIINNIFKARINKYYNSLKTQTKKRKTNISISPIHNWPFTTTANSF